MTPSSELTRSRRKPRVMWHDVVDMKRYEVTLASKAPEIRKALLEGDWRISEKPRKRRKKKSQHPTKTPAKRNRKRK